MSIIQIQMIHFAKSRIIGEKIDKGCCNVSKTVCTLLVALWEFLKLMTYYRRNSSATSNELAGLSTQYRVRCGLRKNAEICFLWMHKKSLDMENTRPEIFRVPPESKDMETMG